ncbi:MAG: ThiF family adenylyltransferase [Candidatus Aenigmatarchaeota archaeon]
MELYDRQERLMGEERQDKLRNSKVLVLGCGALGSLTANHLARAGVNLRLVDRDIVEESNLQRTLYRKKDAGKAKAPALKEILGRSTEVEIETVVKDFNRFSWEETTKNVDLVVDCFDAMRPRYLLNEISVRENIPFVHGAAIKTQGRLKTFLPEGECLRCLYKEKPEPGSLDTCRDVGVLNSVTSFVSFLQANEALKYIADIGEVEQRLIAADLKKNNMNRIEVDKDEGCPVCVQGEYEMLSGEGDLIIREICGGYQVVPREVDLDLKGIVENHGGDNKEKFASLDYQGKNVILFEDGRMRVDTESKDEAKKIYSKIVGL